MQRLTLLALTFFLICTASWNAAADENIKPPVSFEELRADILSGKVVKGKTVEGDHIIKMIQETADLEEPPAIQLEDCIIEKGLDFTQLPLVPIQEVKLPTQWDEKRKKDFTGKYKEARVVENIIKITKCKIKDEIHSGNNRIENLFSAKNILPLFFCKKVDFFETKFEKEVNFILVSFSDYTIFEKARFSRDAYFESVSFGGNAYFESTSFSHYAGFKGAYFRYNSLFLSASFNGLTDFSWANFNGNAEFRKAIFSSGADFTKASFSGYADFRKANFSGGAYFNGIHVSDNMLLNWTSFKGNTDFGEASFSRNIYFTNTIFEKTVQFKGSFFERLVLPFSRFKRYADFRDTEIRHLDFNSEKIPVIIESRMDFRNARISAAHFQDIIFQQDVDFSDAQFGYNFESEKDFIGPPRLCQPHDYASLFRFVTFESDVSFIRTKFQNAIAFERTNFKKKADFKEADFKHKNGKERFGFSYINFNELKINWEQLPEIGRWVKNADERIKTFVDLEEEENQKRYGQGKKSETVQEKPECLSEALKTLEENFRTHNQLEDANEAYFHMKEAEREELKTGKKDGSRFWKEVQWIVWGMICGYGTNVWWALGWSFFFVIAFALLYMQDIERENPSHAEIRENSSHDYNWKQRILEWPWLYIKTESGTPVRFPSRKFINALRFSFTVFFKFGPRDTTISGKIICFNYLFLVWVEWLLGFYMLACIFYTLSNSMPLLNTLLRGVF